jgi:hypothetical protein
VIQVIGETSNKSAELKKFVQTFVLAQQPTGYFVLNDIFRYINEEGEEEAVETTQEESAAAGPLVEDVEMPKAQAVVEEPVAAPLDAEIVDKKLEETMEAEPVVEAAPTTNGTTPAPKTEAEEISAPAAKVEDVPTPEVAAKEVEEEVKEPEKPKEPVATPAPRAQPTAKPVPVQPAGPPKPLSWASRAAAAVGTTPKPAVPVIAPKSTATPPAQTRTAPPPAQAPKAVVTPAATVTPAEKDKENSNAGWQSVGDNAKRQNRPQSISAPPEKEGTMGYVRNVTEKVATDELRTALGSYGNMIYFDVNRTKVSLG